MEKVIKNNGEIISYTSTSVGSDEVVRLTISITTDNDYSVDGVSNLIKTSIPQMINDTAGENIRLYHIKDINIIFSKYNNLNLNDPLNEFLKSTSTIVLLKNEWEEQWDSWCTDFLERIPTLVPKENNVIQSSNKLTNYLRVVESKFPPIPMYDRTIKSKLELDIEEVGTTTDLPKVVYDITYVSTSEEKTMTLDTDEILQYVFKDAPFTPKEMSNRLKFFYTNLDITVHVFFEINGRSFSFTLSGNLIDNGQTVPS